jgi:hypothetical protein
MHGAIAEGWGEGSDQKVWPFPEANVLPWSRGEREIWLLMCRPAYFT